MEAFYFPVGLWPVAAGEHVADPDRVERVTEQMRAVSGPVISHDGLDCDPPVSEPLDGPFGELEAGEGGLVVEEL